MAEENDEIAAVVLAVLIWTFLKMDDKITALQKAGGGAGIRTEKRRKARKINTAPPLPEKISRQGRRIFTTYFLSCGSSSPLNITMPQNCKAGAQHKTHCPQRHAEQNAHATPNRIPAI